MSQKTAVILVNLGTPDAPSKSAVRRYLKEFLFHFPKGAWGKVCVLVVDNYIQKNN